MYPLQELLEYDILYGKAKKDLIFWQLLEGVKVKVREV